MSGRVPPTLRGRSTDDSLTFARFGTAFSLLVLTRLELREQKVRLDKEFGEMLGKIADRKDRLQHMEKKLATLDRTRLGKEVRPNIPRAGVGSRPRPSTREPFPRVPAASSIRRTSDRAPRVSSTPPILPDPVPMTDPPATPVVEKTPPRAEALPRAKDRHAAC